MSEVSAPAALIMPKPDPQPVALPTTFGSRRLLGIIGLLIFLPLLFLPGYILQEDKYWLPLFTRYMALAIFAVSVDLVWGYTGLLSLGQGLYFGLGAYAIGYSLKLQAAAINAGQP